MGNSNSVMAHKLQRAINEKFNERILLNRQQWYSEEQHRPVTVYCIRKAIYDEEKHRTHNIDLFKSPSELQIVLWLRDKWYELNLWPLPPADEKWQEVRNTIKNGTNEIN